MNKIIAIIIIAAACGAVLFFFFFFFYNKGTTDTSATTPEPVNQFDESIHEIPPIEEPLDIVVSTDLIKEILYQFARNRTNEPYICIESGVNPLVYTPSPEDKEKILAADLVLYTGLGMEPGLEAYINTIKDKVKCKPLSGFTAYEGNSDNEPDGQYQDILLESSEYESGFDPHFWWNPRIWEKAIRQAVRALAEVDPAYEFNYKSIFIRYGQSLSLLDKRYIASWSRRLAVERKHLVTLHPAFTYFADKYGYKTMSLYTPDSPGTVSAARRKAVARYVVDNKVPSIFPEVGFPMTEIKALQAEVKKMGYDVGIGEHLYSYFLGGEGSKDFIYLKATRTLMDRIYYGLKSVDDPEMPDQ
jgi:manganese/zinc/iron transport system substrate-binding protein